MTFNFNVTAMKNELASGVSMDELAKAMTDALNEAQKQYEAEETKRKEVEAQKERESRLAKARADIKSDFITYMKLMMPELVQRCSDEDWKELDLILDQSLNELEICFEVILPLLNLKPMANKPKPIGKGSEDALTRFLRDNGLM
jgi:hypothetical protein